MDLGQRESKVYVCGCRFVKDKSDEHMCICGKKKEHCEIICIFFNAAFCVLEPWNAPHPLSSCSVQLVQFYGFAAVWSY